ncbi:MAG: peptidase E [Kordia sp.]|nr:MAG: peptidase E [Kordia sp.]
MRVFKLSIAGLIVLISLTSFMSLHKYYVSVTDIEYAKETKSLQIISRLFVDDFEEVLKERYVDTLSLGDYSADFYIEKYFVKKLQVTVNKELQQFKFIGKEIDGDMVHCYFEIESISKIETIKVTNKLLFDTYKSQQNITHLKINGKKKSFLFIKDKSSGLLKL